MHAYPPEYDEPCTLSITAPELPGWLDPTIYWDDDGCVFVLRKDNGRSITLLNAVEATDSYDDDCAWIKHAALVLVNRIH